MSMLYTNYRCKKFLIKLLKHDPNIYEDSVLVERDQSMLGKGIIEPTD